MLLTRRRDARNNIKRKASFAPKKKEKNKLRRGVCKNQYRPSANKNSTDSRMTGMVLPEGQKVARDRRGKRGGIGKGVKRYEKDP